MEQLLVELLQKVEEIKSSQEEILSRLDHTIVYPQIKSNPSIKKKSKKKEEREQIEEMKAVIINGPLLREKFNLAVTPQYHRVIAYLRTGNESAFDGLKRKG